MGLLISIDTIIKQDSMQNMLFIQNKVQIIILFFFYPHNSV